MAKTIANQIPPSKVSGRLATLHRILEEAGLSYEDLQRPIDDPEMRKRLVRFWRSGGFEPTASQKLARAILPNGHFFGPEDWFARFGDRVSFTKKQLAQAVELPWSEDKLENPGIKQAEFVFLVPAKVDGGPVTLKHLHEVFPEGGHPKFYLEWYLTGEPFADEVAYEVTRYGTPGILQVSGNSD